jgi:hypothetical protein
LIQIAPFSKPSKKAIRDKLIEKWDTQMNNCHDTFIMAAFLDPRFKDFRWAGTKQEEYLQQAKQITQDAIEALPSLPSAAPALNPPTSPLLSPQKRRLGAFDYMNALGDLWELPRQREKQKEIDEYFGMPPISMKRVGMEELADPLAWWSNNEAHFPTLSRLVRRVLSISATSLPCERSFSKAGLIVTKRRTALSDKNVALLFLAANKTHW